MIERWEQVAVMIGVFVVLFMLYKTGAVDAIAGFAERESRAHFKMEQGMRRWRSGRNPRGGPRL